MVFFNFFIIDLLNLNFIIFITVNKSNTNLIPFLILRKTYPNNSVAYAIDFFTTKETPRAISNLNITAGRGEIRVAMEPQMGGNL